MMADFKVLAFSCLLLAFLIVVHCTFSVLLARAFKLNWLISNDFSYVLFLISVGISSYSVFLIMAFYPDYKVLIYFPLLSIPFIANKNFRQDFLLVIKFISPSLLLILVVLFFYTGVVGSGGGLLDVNSVVAHRYWVSVDNKIPLLFAERLINGGEGFIVGDWLTGDRPPLATGFLLLFYSYYDINSQFSDFIAFMAGSFGNLLWIFPVVALLQIFGLDRARSFSVIIAILFLGPIFINTVYVWPKLLTVAFSLAALHLVWSKVSLGRMINFNVQLAKHAFVVSVLLSLSYLSHGAVVFFIIAFFLIFLLIRGDNKSILFYFLGVFLISFTFVYPFSYYQKNISPPSDRLAKWHLAGQIEPVNKKFYDVLIDNYSDLGVIGALSAKINNLRAFVGFNDKREQINNNPMPAWESSFIGQFMRLSLSAIFFVPAFFVLGFVFLNKNFINNDRFKFIFFLTSLTFFIYALLEFGADPSAQALLHTAPFTVVILYSILLIYSAVQRSIIFFKIVFLLNASLFFGVWWFYALFHGAASDYLFTNINFLFLSMGLFFGSILLMFVLVETGRKGFYLPKK